jgi:hypothetical protein
MVVARPGNHCLGCWSASLKATKKLKWTASLELRIYYTVRQPEGCIMVDFSLYQLLVVGLLALIVILIWGIVRGGGKDLEKITQRLERAIDSHLIDMTGGLQSILEAVHAQTNYMSEMPNRRNPGFLTPSDHGSSDRWELPSDLGSSDRRELISELRVIRKLLEAQHRHSGLTDLE